MHNTKGVILKDKFTIKKMFHYYFADEINQITNKHIGKISNS